MKKEAKLNERIIKTSFQTQLFLIVLVCFILFVVLDYIIIEYSFRNRYIKSKIDSVSSDVISLSSSLNDSGKSRIEVLEDFTEERGYITVVVNSDSGAFSLTDYEYQSYQVDVTYNDINYTLNIPEFNFVLNVGDVIDAYIEAEAKDGVYEVKSLSVQDKTYMTASILDGLIHLDGASITSIKIPKNLNYLYRNNKIVTRGINVLNTRIKDFTDIKTDTSIYYSYYLDRTNGYLFYLSKPTSFEGNSDFIFVISSFIETDSLLSIVSSYYGYIVLGSIVIAVGIALFISRAFSLPLKTLEKEMKNLASGNYETSSHNFKNVEMVSLQNTINEVKRDTEENVTNIEMQKQSLEKLNQELLNEEELRKSFIARLSHELKTPLMVISATTEAMMSGLIPEKDQEAEYNNILNEVDKTTGIIKDIINTYRNSTTEMRLKTSRFKLNVLVENVLHETLPIAQNKKLKVKLNIITPVYMDADEELIGQVVSNFITNAFKYTEDRNVVEINILDQKTSIIFEVINYGSKISNENLEKIWLPFFRENENVDSSSTGMGLYIVKSILDTHGYEYGVVNIENGVRSYFKVNK